MASSPIEQAASLLTENSDILLVVPAHPRADALGAALGLSRVLTELKKNNSIISQGPIHPAYHFLPGSKNIMSRLPGGKEFIISLNTKEAPVEELRYEQEGEHLKIYLTPKAGELKSQNLNTEPGTIKHDLIITMDTRSLDDLGNIYTENRDTFFATPIINIDHRPYNSKFGQVNIVDLAATATAEIVTRLIPKISKQRIDAETATCLLAGIISDTQSFQHPATTPNAFHLSSRLIAAGADQQAIIRHLYKTKPLSLLKLWGRVLARMQHDNDHNFTWSLCSLNDLKTTGASEDQLMDVMRELRDNTPNAELVLVLCEIKPNQTQGWIYPTRTIEPSALASAIDGRVFSDVLVTINRQGQTLHETEEQVLSALRSYLKTLTP